MFRRFNFRARFRGQLDVSGLGRTFCYYCRRPLSMEELAKNQTACNECLNEIAQSQQVLAVVNEQPPLYGPIQYMILYETSNHLDLDLFYLGNNTDHPDVQLDSLDTVRINEFFVQSIRGAPGYGGMFVPAFKIEFFELPTLGINMQVLREENDILLTSENRILRNQTGIFDISEWREISRRMSYDEFLMPSRIYVPAEYECQQSNKTILQQSSAVGEVPNRRYWYDIKFIDIRDERLIASKQAVTGRFFVHQDLYAIIGTAEAIRSNDLIVLEQV